MAIYLNADHYLLADSVSKSDLGFHLLLDSGGFVDILLFSCFYAIETSYDNLEFCIAPPLIRCRQAIAFRSTR